MGELITQDRTLIRNVAKMVTVRISGELETQVKSSKWNNYKADKFVYLESV
jgi:hypothetical protein